MIKKFTNFKYVQLSTHNSILYNKVKLLSCLKFYDFRNVKYFKNYFVKKTLMKLIVHKK